MRAAAHTRRAGVTLAELILATGLASIVVAASSLFVLTLLRRPA